ncbi:hypothetical protein V5799_026238 [Amblyomma americanum]|uniref:Peptidase M13 N-terminal domain-containing protein n=1 Tax=Amblyomma americanum TaxID=6943 RepID=A0AAQ4DJ59_AMBAM
MKLNLVHDLAEACQSRSCREALWLINASCLTSADICHDFYGFVCGSWSVKGALGDGLSYALALGFNYTSKVDGALPRILAWSQSKDTDSYKVALVYRSCVNFFANATTNLDNMFRAARVDPRAFLKAENFSELFSLSIRTVIENKLTSVWKVVYPHDGGVGILTGTSMLARSFIPEIRQALLEQLASSTGDKGFFKMAEPITTLDAFIQNVTELHSEETALDEALTSSDDFPIYGVYWEKALHEFSPSRSIENERANTVRTNNAGAIRSIVQKLASVPLDIAKAYMLLVPFATYLGFELKTASRRGFLPHSIRTKQCVGYLTSMFGDRAQAVLMEVMKTEKAVALANQMWQNIKHKAGVMTKLGTSFTLERDSLLNATLKVHDATEASVNYGTLGAYMARMLFTASLPKSSPHKYVDCLDNYAKRNSIPFDKTAWQRYVKMNWSMNVAFESLPMATNVRRRILQGRYFFLRYAIFFCGEDVKMKKGLQFALKSSSSFATVFNCYQPPKNTCE